MLFFIEHDPEELPDDEYAKEFCKTINRVVHPYSVKFEEFKLKIKIQMYASVQQKMTMRLWIRLSLLCKCK